MKWQTKAPLIAGLIAMPALWANTECMPPANGKPVSDRYYKLCPKKQQKENPESSTLPEDNLGEADTSLKKRFGEQRGIENPFNKYPKKGNLYVPKPLNKNWWEQNGQPSHLGSQAQVDED